MGEETNQPASLLPLRPLRSTLLQLLPQILSTIALHGSALWSSSLQLLLQILSSIPLHRSSSLQLSSPPILSSFSLHGYQGYQSDPYPSLISSSPWCWEMWM
jgi:hypothetical protein